MSQNIWFTSDTHFSHDREFIYKARGFNSIWEHDEQIIKNWNSVVQPGDQVYHLGDVFLGSNDFNGPGMSCLKQLKGDIHIIRGNHCTNTRMALYDKCWNVVEITEGQFFKYGKYHFYLSHFPCIVSNYDADKPLKARMISLCGHSHTKDSFVDFDKGLIFHCELDTNNCFLWNIDDIIIKIKEKLNEKY